MFSVWLARVRSEEAKMLGIVSRKVSRCFYRAENVDSLVLEWIFYESLVRECGYGELMAVCIRFWPSLWGGLGQRCRH